MALGMENGGTEILPPRSGLALACIDMDGVPVTCSGTYSLYNVGELKLVNLCRLLHAHDTRAVMVWRSPFAAVGRVLASRTST